MKNVIYVITHKEVAFKLPENYRPMMVGAYRFHDHLQGYTYDNDGEHTISNRNANYCELTGLYWIWKNNTDDIKGLVHYRRFFTRNRFSNNQKYYYNTDRIYSILEKHDIIVAERGFVNQKSNYENYANRHYEKDWISVKAVIKSTCPNYLNAFKNMEESNWFYPYNMLISKRNIYDLYCEWLFSVLFQLEKKVNIEGYDVQQSRIFGFLSERLLRVWIETNKIKVYEAPVIQTDSTLQYRARRCAEKMTGRRMK